MCKRDPTLTLLEYKEALARFLHVDVSLPTICQAMKKIKLSRKKMERHVRILLT